ncbi:hypothetical protein TKK_0008628 [Trichogramma kaykai]
MRDSRTFIISSDDEDYDDLENEMIQMKDIEHLIEPRNGEVDNYEQLHRFVAKFNNGENESFDFVRKNKDIGKDFFSRIRSAIKHPRRKRNDENEKEALLTMENSIDEESNIDKSTVSNDVDELEETTTSTRKTTTTEISKTTEETTIGTEQGTTTTIWDKPETSITSEEFTENQESKTTTKTTEKWKATDETTEKFKTTDETTENWKTTDETTKKWKITDEATETTESFQNISTSTVSQETATTISGSNEFKTTESWETTVDTTKNEGQNKATELTTTTEAPMEYERIMPEYSADIENITVDEITFKYSEEEIQSTMKKLLKKQLDIKKPRNCSNFKGFKYGVTALECAFDDLVKSSDSIQKRTSAARLWKILKIWLIIYVIIAVPCWCTRGWCCCCCRCKSCFPYRMIDYEKQYYAKNPPGILVEKLPKGKEKAEEQAPIKYEATLYEEDAYADFESAIRHL